MRKKKCESERATLEGESGVLWGGERGREVFF